MHAAIKEPHLPLQLLQLLLQQELSPNRVCLGVTHQALV
jgi:hypothetical protein